VFLSVQRAVERAVGTHGQQRHGATGVVRDDGVLSRRVERDVARPVVPGSRAVEPVEGAVVLVDAIADC
jgi:hypothetical protein